MNRRILIITETNDSHALAVAECARAQGAEAVLWHTSDFPMRAEETLLFEQGKRTLRVRDASTELEGGTFDAVLNRRPARWINPAVLHPADAEFAELSCREFRQSIYEQLNPGTLWVNPHDTSVRASRKMNQLAAAHTVGMPFPDTLVSNDPEEIRGFIRRHGGRIIFKPFKSLPWQDDVTYHVIYTTMLMEEHLVEDEMLRVAPGIYQELVPKAYELRVTMIGDRAFSAKIPSQETEGGKMDWRRSPAELRFERHDLPPAVTKLSKAVLDRLGIVFGCFDFIVTPDGRYVFLEVNQMGQFLFIEAAIGAPLVQAVTSYLLNGVTLPIGELRGPSWADLHDRVAAQAKANAAIHPPIPSRAWYEGTTPPEAPPAFQLT